MDRARTAGVKAKGRALGAGADTTWLPPDAAAADGVSEGRAEWDAGSMLVSLSGS